MMSQQCNRMIIIAGLSLSMITLFCADQATEGHTQTTSCCPLLYKKCIAFIKRCVCCCGDATDHVGHTNSDAHRSSTDARDIHSKQEDGVDDRGFDYDE